MTGKKIFSAFVGGAVVFGMLLPVGEAAKIDAYRNILIGNKYTIKYDNITPAPRVTNRDKVPLFGKSGMSVEQNDYLTNRQKSGLITADGQDKYEEVGDGEFNMCRLRKGNEDFYFTKYKKGDKYEYFGTQKNKVEANAKNYLAEMLEGQSYGDPDASRLLNALLPANKKSANMPNYVYAAGGTLPNGTSYEDYKATRDGINSVVRYYFKGSELVKIAAAEYYRGSDGKIDGQKCIIRINEFSSVPDAALLKLPDGVTDVTKRNKKKGAAK